tara:strand:+ start:109 stop:327 length:219 start_codon:yes stop_codon:yes gene_type:complete
MKTIKEIITRLNYLEKNGKQIQKEKGDYYWLQEINKWESLFCNHPDADKTRHSDSSEYIKLEMKSTYQKEAK